MMAGQNIDLSDVDGVISDVRVIVHSKPFDANAVLLHGKRTAIRCQAEDLMAGIPVKILRDGKPYTLQDVYTDLPKHNLYNAAVQSAYFYDVKPMRDLIRRITQRVVAEHLCPDEADYLGFLK